MPNDNIKNEGKETQFKPGQSGNPKGRPKLPDLRQAMADILGEEKEGKTALEMILKKLRAMASAGNVKAMEILLSRGYGLPKQNIDHSISTGAMINISKDGNEISLKIKTDESIVTDDAAGDL